METFNPWEHFPSLKLDRLKTLATTIQDARNSVVPLFDPEAGDNSWCTHCRAYARQCKALRQLTNKVNWLRVSSSRNEDLELSMCVENVPLKVFRGEQEDYPIRHREFSRGEQMLIDRIMAQFPAGPLRLVVTTNERMLVSSIALVEFDDSTPWRSFQIPIDGAGQGFTIPQPDPISPPPITPHPDVRRQDTAFA